VSLYIIIGVHPCDCQSIRAKEGKMTDPTISASNVAAAIRKSIHDHWGVFLAEGIIFVILGLLAILVPQLATLAVTILLGWLFVASGIMGLVATYWARGAPGFWWALLSALLAIAVGVILLARPFAGELSLTYLLIAFFFIEGIASIMYAIEHRRELTDGWIWMLLSGVVTLALGVIILLGLPGTAGWALGLLVGIDMVFGGCALMAIALAARKQA
jgi:uncharacterized membrane protein HdeD (DUF308 family)